MTMIFAVAQLFLAPVSTSLLARHLGAHDFGAYSSLQRLVLLIAPLSSLGVSVGVTRYVASARGKPKSKSFFWGAIAVTVSGALLVSLALGLVPESVLGDLDASAPGWLIFLLLTAFVIQSLLGAWLRGNGDYFVSNVMHLLSELGKLVFLVLLFLFDWQLHIAMVLLTILMVQISIDVVLVSVTQPIDFRPRFLSWSHTKTLLTYSVPRVPGGLSLQALNSIGIFYFSLQGESALAGFMALSLVLLNAGSMVFSRLGSILMPHLVFELSKSEDKDSAANHTIPGHVKSQLSIVISLLLSVAAISGAAGILALPTLIVPWLGQDFASTELPVSVLSSCIGIVALYSVLAGAVNAVDTRPLNTVNLTVALLAAGGVLAIHQDLNTTQVAIIQAFGFALLAALTIITVLRLYDIVPRDIGLTGFIVLTVTNTIIVSTVLLINQDFWARAIGVLAIVAADLAIIWKLSPPWLPAIIVRLSRITGRA